MSVPVQNESKSIWFTSCQRMTPQTNNCYGIPSATCMPCASGLKLSTPDHSLHNVHAIYYQHQTKIHR